MFVPDTLFCRERIDSFILNFSSGHYDFLLPQKVGKNGFISFLVRNVNKFLQQIMSSENVCRVDQAQSTAQEFAKNC
jgi:hypothetical protein